MDNQDTASPFVPEEFLALAEREDSITARTARRFGVSPHTFVNWRWQMKHQVTDEKQAQEVIELLPEESNGFYQLQQLFHAGITPYYMGLMLPKLEAGEGDCPIRLQALPRVEELRDRLGVADPLSEVPHSPVREVVHVYPDRVAFCVAQLCPVYCRYCFRKRRDEEVGLHFNRSIIDQGIAYIRKNPA
ncbi:MAG: hypothetical protein ACOVS5_03540, partial [Oligoflexus sp.]